MKKYDIAIIGSGIAGSTLAAILAKKGISTIVIDAKHHPRFAIGESMVPESATLLIMLARWFDIPELEACSHPTTLRNYAGPTCGVKRNFGFVHHEQGQPQNIEHQVMAPIFPPEAHIFRQDADAFMFHTAIAYGADAIQGALVTELTFHDDSVVIETNDGQEFVVDFLVDATGPASLLARKFGLRADPDTIQTHAGTLFTHMIGVRPFEDAVHPMSEHGFPVSFSQGTLHHVFDGGWVWIIPFDNHKYSVNRLCSVGIQYDPRRFDLRDDTAEVAYQRILEAFPGIAAQFDGARAVREWVKVPRMQYRSRSLVGPRWCLSAHSAGFIDPLFSRGLVITFESTLRLADFLVNAAATGDYDTSRLAPLERTVQGYLDANDRLVASSYTAFRDFDLWNAWYRIWSSGAFFAGTRMKQIWAIQESEGLDAAREALESPAAVGRFSRGLAEYDALFDSSCRVVESVERGEVTLGDAADEIFRLLRDAESFLPPFEYSNPDKRYPFAPGREIEGRIKAWSMDGAPASVQAFCFARKPPPRESDYGTEYDTL